MDRLCPYPGKTFCKIVLVFIFSSPTGCLQNYSVIGCSFLPFIFLNLLLILVVKGCSAATCEAKQRVHGEA